MNFSYFISNKLQLNKEKSFSGTVSSIGISAIAIGLAIMIISFSIAKGYQNSIKEKIFSIGGHLQVKQFNRNNSYEEVPISLNSNLFKNYKTLIPEIKSIHPVTQKAGLLKTDEELLGVILKGVDKNFNDTGFKENLIAGGLINFPAKGYSQDIIISKNISDKLSLKINDNVIVYFIQNPPKARKLVVKGIYETNMEEFDENLIIGDINLLRRINNWSDTVSGGYEIYLNKFEDLPHTIEKLENVRDFDLEIVSDKFVSVLDWLDLIYRNVFIFLILILFVAVFNMLSIVFILIMERTQMIGLLKSIGANDWVIRKIFLWKAVNLILKGLLWGNIAGLGFCCLQYYTHLIPLDKKNYYMSSVPIFWDWPMFFLLNLIIVGLVLGVMIIPTYMISKIQPVKAIRFD